MRVATTKRVNADRFALTMKPEIERLNAAGITRVNAIARALNEQGCRTRLGCSWHAASVRNLVARLQGLAD